MTMDIGLAPEDQDKLAQLLGGKLGGNVADLFAKGASGVSPNPTRAMPIPGMPQSAGPTAPPPAAASDDPAITGRTPTSPMPGSAPAPPLPRVPTFQQPPVGTMQDLSKQIATASQPVRRQDYQPHWWEKLLSVPFAGVEGYGDANRGIAAGRSVLDRRYNLALENQKKTVTPLEAEFERQSKIEPYISAANRNAQETFSDQDALYKNWNATEDRKAGIEERRQATSEATEQRRDAASERADTRQQEQDRKNDEDKSTPAPGARPELTMVNGKPALRVKTKSGDYIPYVPKSIDEGAMLGDPGARSLYEMAHPGRAGEKEAGKAQFRLIESKHQDAIEDAEEEYKKAVKVADGYLAADRKLSTREQIDQSNAARAQAADTLEAKKLRIERAYKAEIIAAGGNVDSPSPPAGAAPVKFDLGADAQGNVKKAKVQEYATRKGITYDEARKGVESKGYTVQ